MNTHDHDDEQGLTPEERALARRLARLGPHAEPSSALDARILAAAHAAAEPEPIRPRRDAQRRKAARWPTVFGFAASLALACGIAWQLRPVPEAPTATQQKIEGEEPLAEFVRPPPSPPMQVRTLPPKELKVPEPPPPAQAVRAPQRAAIRAATPDDAREKPRAVEQPMAFEIDEAIHPESAAAAAPAQPALESAAVAADMAAPAPAAPPAAAAKAAANAQQRAEAFARERADAEPAFAEPDEEVVPPATASDPAVRDAWLVRIRELVKTGDEEAARASLKAFRERYPRYVLPDDLRALEHHAPEE